MKVGCSFGALWLDDYWRGQLKESGMECLECGFESSWFEAENFQKCKQYVKQAQENGLELWSAHLPFWKKDEKYPVDMASLVKAERDWTVAFFADAIKKASMLGINKYVIHPSFEPLPKEGKEREEHLKGARESFAALAELAAREGSVIAVETLPRTCLGHNSEEMQYIISGDERLRVCLDTNHLTLESNITFIDNLRDKIITTHISDFDLVGEKHWIPGEGKLEWVPIYQKLLEVGYKGPWLYEVNASEKCQTLKRERNWTTAEIFQNAQEIFSGKEPTRPEWSKPL